MDINDIKNLAVERIYLVPDASEGQLGYLWCDDPAPSEGMDPAEAVEYIRKDVHDAIIAKQASAARQGMDAAKVVASSNLEQAKRLYAECSPEALESEREANAKLTELVAELERERDAYRAAEEIQIALRQKMEADRDALAAHVERIIAARNSRRGDTLANICAVIDESTHQTSLARRDALSNADYLDEMAVIAEQYDDVRWTVGELRKEANRLREESEAPQ